MPWTSGAIAKAIPAVLCISGAEICRGQLATNITPASHMTLPETVVTSTRDEYLVHDVPYSTAVLSSDTLRVGQSVRTVPEALKYTPGTMVQRTSHGQGSPYIRGFTGYRNLMLVDGIRLNNAVFRDGPNQYWNTVDALALNRIEVVRGPSSALYGSDAVGGTVQAFTRGESELRAESDWDRRLYHRYAGAENSHIARAESIGRLTEDLTLTLGYTFKDFGNLQGGRDVGTQPKTGYGERHWDAKLEYRIHDDATLTAAHQHGAIDDAWRTHSTIYGIEWEGLTPGSDLLRSLDQRRDLSYVQYREDRSGGCIETIHTGVYRQGQTERQERLRTRERWDVQGFDVETLGAFLTLTSPLCAGRLLYGADIHRDATDTFSKTLNPDGSIRGVAIQGPVADGATYDMVGLFLQSETPLNERTDAILGGRYAYARADAPRVEDPTTGEPISVSGEWDTVVGSARMRYALDAQKTANLFAGVSQGFRAPNLSDLTRFDTARTGEIETPSPDLDPERFLSCEAGLKLSTLRLTAQLAYAYTFIDGMIVRTPTGRTIDDSSEVTKKNAGDGYLQTVELDARYLLQDGLSAIGTVTWMDGKVDTYPTADAESTRDTIDRLMPPTGRFGLRWERRRQYWIETACTVAARADRLSTNDRADTSRIPTGGTPGYAVFDIRTGWQITPDLTFGVALENVADEDYRIHGSGINEPGRNLVLTADWTF